MNDLMNRILLEAVETREKAITDLTERLRQSDERRGELAAERVEFIKRRDEYLNRATGMRLLINDLIEVVRGKTLKLSTDEGGTEMLSVAIDVDRESLKVYFLQRLAAVDELP